MSEPKFDEMIYAYSAGCLDKEELLDFLDYSNSGGKLAEKKLGELQNLTSLLPLILETEMPHPQVRDKFARRLFRLRDEVRVKAKANMRNGQVNIPDEAPKPAEIIPEPMVNEEINKVEIKKEEPKKEEFKKEEPKKEEPKKEEPKKEPVKVEEKKPEPFVKKPEIPFKKVDVVEKKEPVKEPEKNKFVKEEKKPFKPEIKEEKKPIPVIPEKEAFKAKEPVAEKITPKEKFTPKPVVSSIEEEEEKGGISKFIYIGAAVVVIAVVIFFLTRGGSNNVATNQPPADNAAIKAKQEQIAKLNEQLANIQTTPNGGNTANQGTNDQQKVDELTKKLQALQDEIKKMNESKNSPQQTSQQQNTQQTTQQQTTQQNNQQVEQPKEQTPVQTQPVAVQPKQANNNDTPTQGNEVKTTQEPQFVTFAEEMPTPVGGMQSIVRKVNVPEKAINAGVEGKVYVKAFIDENGNVVRTSVAKGLGYGCDEIAEFAVKSTKFNPGKNKGKPVKVEALIQVPFKL